MKAAKPFAIPKQLIWQAYENVKAKKGAAGIDRETMCDFENNLKDNLYRIWNRMSSGSYYPPAVKGIYIPKKSGGKRLLGIPTVSDRIAQTAVKIILEPILEPLFLNDSYGYRPGKSAHEAIATTRTRCWKYDWVVEFDIKNLFDSIDHNLLMKALRLHCNHNWILLYVERWLKVPLEYQDGSITERQRGTPQGGVVSPILANLFLHYAFDVWIRRALPGIPFCRYADDGLLHCKSYLQAEDVLSKIGKRFFDCGLEIHPTKSGIIYCKDKNRKEKFKRISFDFLGYTFRPRRCVNKQGIHPNFLPAISRTSKKAINHKIRQWHIQIKNEKSLAELSEIFNPILIGWNNYYGRFYASSLRSIWKNFNWYLMQWVRRKYKKFLKHKRQAMKYLSCLAKENPNLFIHWKLGILPKG